MMLFSFAFEPPLPLLGGMGCKTSHYFEVLLIMAPHFWENCGRFIAASCHPEPLVVCTYHDTKVFLFLFAVVGHTVPYTRSLK